MIAQLKLRGIKIICDIDNYWNLPKTHALHNLYKETKMSKCIQSNIQLADVIWTTTKSLADEIQKINKNVFVVKNCLDIEEDQFRVKMQSEQNFDKFFWSGGVSHKQNLELIRGAVDDVDFTIQGWNKKLPWMKEWFPNANFLLPQTLDKYAAEMNNHRVVLIPTVKSKFNSLKSELKIIEAGHFGRAVICSNVHPYKSHLKRYKNCLKSEDNEWSKWIQRIKGDHNMQMELGMALNEYVRENYKLEKENKLRFDTL